MKPEHLLYERFLPPLGGQMRQLKSRQPFVPAALELVNNPTQSGTSVARWAEDRWDMKWQKTLLDSIYLLKILFQRCRELVFPDLHESSFTASEPTLFYSVQKRANSVWLLRQPVSVAQRSRQLNT